VDPCFVHDLYGPLRQVCKEFERLYVFRILDDFTYNGYLCESNVYIRVFTWFCMVLILVLSSSKRYEF
jgi:hypothetical protein